MELLRNLGSAAASSLLQKSGISLPFSLGERVTSYNGKSIWTLHDAIKKDDNSQVSVFIFESIQSNKALLPLAKNALRKLRTIRHPDILKFIDVVETDTGISIMTERVRPLGPALQEWASKPAKAQEEWIIWGLHRISVALAFINDSCTSTHGNINVNSIFISPSGEWRLGGFEVLSTPKEENAVLYSSGSLSPLALDYAPPEVKKSQAWSALRDVPIEAPDGYALGLLLHSVFNRNAPLPPTSQPPHPPPAANSRGSIPTSLWPPFKRLLNPSAKARMTPKAFLQLGMGEKAGDGARFFADNHLVQVCAGLDQFAIGSDAEKAALLRSLKNSAASFPPEFASNRVLPALISALDFGGASAASILPLVFELGKTVSSSDYNSKVLQPVVKLYVSPDRGTRMALLDMLPEYAEKLDAKTVTDKIWPHLQTGFTDTVAVIRESTVRSIDHIHAKLSDRILNNELLRHLAKSQMDPEPSIRTNTCILIAKLAPSLNMSTKKKVLVPAFTRALKDQFVHARVAGLSAFLACVDYLDGEDLASKCVPAFATSTVDKEKLVRDQAFKCFDVYLTKLQEYARSLPETMLPPTENGASTPGANGYSTPVPGDLMSSATGAAGALAGWAMSSISRKLITTDLSTVIGSTPSIGTASPGPNTLAPPNASTTRTSFDSISAVQTRTAPEPTAPGLGITSKPAVASKGKGLALRAKKTTLADVLAAEMADEIGDAWGEVSAAQATSPGHLNIESKKAGVWSAQGDLMDINADQDDWTAFESAPSQPTIDVAWGDTLDDTPAATPAPAPARTPNLSTRKPSPAPASLAGPLPDLTITRPSYQAPSIPSSSAPPSRIGTPQIRTSISNDWDTDDGGWSGAGGDDSSSGTKTAAKGLSAMSKENKVVEMARRREERKQRIAQLKEQKKGAA